MYMYRYMYVCISMGYKLLKTLKYKLYCSKNILIKKLKLKSRNRNKTLLMI